jgi:hypothetical protein
MSRFSFEVRLGGTPMFARISSHLALITAAGFVGMLAAAACSGTADHNSSGFGGDGGAGSSGTNTGSSGTNTGSTGVGGAFTTSTSTGMGTGGQGCAGKATKAMEIPLDMFIMLDQSGSMNETVAGGGTKWTAVTNAIQAFVSQPAAAGIGVGIQYFGLPVGGQQCNVQMCNTDADCGAGCGPCFGVCLGALNAGDSCNAADYATAEIPIAPLPGNANAIISSMGKHGPKTNTPTAPALQGSIDYVKAWAQAHPNHVAVNVFATDGVPSECSPMTVNPDIANIAAAGFNGNPKVLTFVIGVGDQTADLNAIAAAGGTQQAFNVDTNGNANQQFLDALNKIRGTALACSYAIPEPMGQKIDYGQVNVTYTPGGGGAAQTIPKVANKAACGNADGWFYDNDANPTQIVMCDTTCNKFSMDAKGEVDIVVGCDTIVK